MESKKVIIAGGSGFIGTALVTKLKELGYEPEVLSRTKGEGKIFWDIEKRIIDTEALEGAYAVISLAGESIFGVWTEAKKNAIIRSRVDSADFLARTISGLKEKPKVFLCASAVGFYGSDPKVVCDEISSKGFGFLPDVCEAWEGACRPAIYAGIRVVNMRFATVLDISGGMLNEYEKLLKWKVGLLLGSHSRQMSWISLSDLLNAIIFVMENDKINEAVNFVSPHTIENFDLYTAVMKRNDVTFKIKIPDFIIKIFAGDMGRSLILSEQDIRPKVLLKNGFTFEDTDLDSIFAKSKTIENH